MLYFNICKNNWYNLFRLLNKILMSDLNSTDNSINS